MAKEVTLGYYGLLQVAVSMCTARSIWVGAGCFEAGFVGIAFHPRPLLQLPAQRLGWNRGSVSVTISVD